MEITRWLMLSLVFTIWTFTKPVDGNIVGNLVDHLMRNYSRLGRPLKNYHDTLNLSFSLTFVSANIDEEDHSLTLVAYENLKWQDEYLVWDPQMYEGVENVVLGRQFIWNPDITLYNPADDVDVSYGQGNTVVYSQGIVNLIRISKSKVRCTSDSLQFPFDTLECSLKFGSWVYSGRKINLTLPNGPADLSLFEDNPKWHMKAVSAHRDTFVYPGFPEPYYTIIYKAKFARPACQYIQLLILPTALLTILSLSLFRLPNYSSGRMILGILLFGAFWFVLLFTFSLVSVWKSVPYFVMFLLFNLVSLVFSMFFNFAFNLLADSREDRKIPKILQTIMFDCFARVFCMGAIVNRHKLRQLTKVREGEGSTTNGYRRLPSPDEKANPDHEKDLSFIERPQPIALGTESKGAVRLEWEDMADVVNKMFVWFYFLVLVSGVCTALMKTKFF